MHSSSLKSALCLLTLLLSTSVALAQSPPPPATPYPGLPIRTVTWNIHPTRIANQTPDDRLQTIINDGRNNDIDIIALQEVPRALLNDPQRRSNFEQVAAAQGYTVLTLNMEYPANGRAPTAARQNAYVVLYRQTHLTLDMPPPAPGTAPGPNELRFYEENRFIEGNAQARPPVYARFLVHHPNNLPDSRLHFFTWHNEAGTMARTHVAQLQEVIEHILHPGYETNHEDWVVTGDFNVQDTTQEMMELERDHHLLTHDADGIDHILSDAPLEDINSLVQPPIEPRLRSSGRHLALFMITRLGATRTKP